MTFSGSVNEQKIKIYETGAIGMDQTKGFAALGKFPAVL